MEKYRKKPCIRSNIQYYWLNINLDINTAWAYNVIYPIMKYGEITRRSSL